MSQGWACKCKPRNVEVLVRNGNYSAFNGYRFAWSRYSKVRCRTCGRIWRTKAKYVNQAPDANREDPRNQSR